MAGAKKYTLEKVQISGETCDLVVKTDADSIQTSYGGKEMTLAESLGTIHSEINKVQNDVGNIEILMKIIRGV